MTKEIILCVDDESIISLTMKQLLKRELGDDYEIEMALNGDDALDIAEELTGEGYRLKLVITDWLMPGMKGDELIRRLRSRYQNVQAIMVSGQADEDIVQKLENNSIRFLSKPWPNKLLIDTIRATLRNR